MVLQHEQDLLREYTHMLQAELRERHAAAATTLADVEVLRLYNVRPHCARIAAHVCGWLQR